jgi:hypothetical protein
MRKKLTAGICALALAVTPAVSALAAPSIGSAAPKDPTATGLDAGQTLVIQAAATEAYESKEVAQIVEAFNDTESTMDVMDIQNNVLLTVASETNVVSADLEEGQTIVVKNVGTVEYENEAVSEVLTKFNKLFSTFEAAVDDEGNPLEDEEGNPVYVSNTKSIADLLQDVFFTAPAAPTLVSGTLEKDETLVLTNADTDRYESVLVQNLVKKFNSSKQEYTLADALEALSVDTEEEIVTNKETSIQLDDYQALSYFLDLAIEKDNDEEDSDVYFGEEEYTVTIAIEAVKGQESEDLLIMLVNPSTEEVYWIEPNSVDPETGEVELTVPCLGTITVLTKGEVPEKTVETEQGNEINPEEYNPLMPFADLLLEDSENLTRDDIGKFEITLTIDSIKDMEMENLLILVMNPEDGSIAYVEPSDYDAETGEITAEFPYLGAVMVATKEEVEEEPTVTNNGNVIFPQDYDTLMPFMDLGVDDGTDVTYNIDGRPVVTFTCELTIDMDPDDMLVVSIDPETKEMTYHEIDEFDPETGEIVVTFENLGPFTIVTKAAQEETEEETEEETVEETQEEQE